jgi:hypothetical protein
MARELLSPLVGAGVISSLLSWQTRPPSFKLRT